LTKGCNGLKRGKNPKSHRIETIRADLGGTGFAAFSRSGRHPKNYPADQGRWVPKNLTKFLRDKTAGQKHQKERKNKRDTPKDLKTHCW